jgi:hypothetical protein
MEKKLLSCLIKLQLTSFLKKVNLLFEHQFQKNYTYNFR